MVGRRRGAVLIGALVCAAGATTMAQDWFGRLSTLREVSSALPPNLPYDGRFVFARIRYGGGLSSFGFGRQPPWAHDYPEADTNLMKILDEITLVTPSRDGTNVFALDDPELFSHPIAYLSEPGYWHPSEREVAALGAYLQKGGFVIFDDFRDIHWHNFEHQMRRVIPGGQLVALDGTHPIFQSFFTIDSPADFVPPYGDEPPVFYGMFEDNDPRRRLMLIANYNNDIGEYWEFSDTGLFPIDLSNEAYKFGVNYIVYAMTH